MLSRPFQDRAESRSIIGSTFQSALARPIKRRPLHCPIGECLTKIGDTEDLIHKITNIIIESRPLIVPVAGFVKPNTQNILDMVKVSGTMSRVMVASSDNKDKRLGAVSSKQKSAPATVHLLNKFLDNKYQSHNARCKLKVKTLHSHSNSNESGERKHHKTRRKRNPSSLLTCTESSKSVNVPPTADSAAAITPTKMSKESQNSRAPAGQCHT